MEERPTVLVPIQVLEGESIPEGVPQLLANAHVVLLGYHVVPEQTATGQARNQFKERAIQRLEEFESILEEEGADVETKLVFTHEGQKTIDRIIYESESIAVLVPNATSPPKDVLVAVRGTVGLDRLVRVVSGLFADTDVTVTLYHVAAEDETEEDVQMLLDGIEDRLIDKGMDAEAIETRTARDQTPREAIVDAANEFDVVVMGESDPSIVTFVFGMRAEQVAEQFLGPVLVVQRERPQEDEQPDTE